MRPIDLKYEGSHTQRYQKVASSHKVPCTKEKLHTPWVYPGGIDLRCYMTEKEMYEQEKQRILTPENLEFIRAVYNAIWGGAENGK